MDRISVVGIDDVTARAAGGTEVAGLIVGAEHQQRRIEQTSLLKSLVNRVGSRTRAVASSRELRVRSAGILIRIRAGYVRRQQHADFADAAALEYAEDVCRRRLSHLITRQRVYIR